MDSRLLETQGRSWSTRSRGSWGELKKLVVKALEAGEEEEKVEEKVGGTIDGEEDEKVVVEDVHMEDRPSVAPTEALEASETSV